MNALNTFIAMASFATAYIAVSTLITPLYIRGTDFIGGRGTMAAGNGYMGA